MIRSSKELEVILNYDAESSAAASTDSAQPPVARQPDATGDSNRHTRLSRLKLAIKCKQKRVGYRTVVVSSSNAAVFKLGSADQRGSATGSQGVCETIPKSSHCLHGF